MRGLQIGLLAISVAALLGCGDDRGPGPANRPPTVTLTSGPIEGEAVHYSVRIAWSGNDPDGFLTRYEYAVDPPPGFTEDEIAHGGPEVSVKEHPEFTRVNKTVDGETVFFDWIHTTDFSRRFSFSASQPETSYTPPVQPTGRFTDMHAVYVRGVDNDGAVSEPDKVAFTAETVAPESRITRPDITAELRRIGLNPVIEWTGTDPDGFGIDEPVSYLYALARLDSLGLPKICIFPDDCGARDSLLRRGIWTEAEPGATLNPTLDPNRQYIFGVRAVDEAGAIEPFLDYGRNLFKFQAFPDGGTPTLTLCSPIFDCLTFRGEETEEIEIGTDTELSITVSCSAEDYGETCLEWRWGVDLADLDKPDGWSEWTTDPVIPDILFRNPGVHVVYVEARDSLGNRTLAALLLNVIRFAFDREVLWIDDAKDSSYPTDAEHDAFWRRMLDGYPGELNWYEHQASTAQNPDVPTLETMGRYRMLVWENAVGFAGQSALLTASTLTTSLRSYLGAGGKLWVGGRITTTAMLPSPNGVGADLNHPKTEIASGDFAYDFMKLRSNRIDWEDGSTPKNFFVGVNPYPGGPTPYNSMSVDITKLRQPFQFALTHCDVVFGPIFAEADPAFIGDIDSLYAYRAYGNEVANQPSSYHGKLNALRWHDPDPDPIHGRIQWFGFPLYYMVEDQAQDTFNKSIDWFREGP